MPRNSVEDLALRSLYPQWILLLMSFSCYCVMQAQVINMSIALVQMVNWTAVEQGKQAPCHKNSTDLSKEPGVFTWSHLMQSQILASALYGMALLRFPAELIAKRINHKWLPFVGTATASMCSFLTPVVAKASKSGYSLFALQIVKAVGQAIIRPSFCLLMDQWVEKKSVHNYISYSEIGQPISGFITVLATGILSDTPNWGWESAFYISGALGVVWCIMWGYLVSDYCFPTPLISGSEPPVSQQVEKVPVPWRHILKSYCVWAYVLVGMTFYWAYSFNILLIPMYLRRVFGVDIKWNTLASAVPNLLQAFMLILATFVSERFVQNKVVKKNTVRKFCVIFGLSGFTGSIILLTFTECGREISCFVLTIGIGFTALTWSALINLPLDMSPRFAGIVSGIMNSVGAFSGAFLPLMVGLISESKEGVNCWYKIFNALVLYSVVALIIFLAFGSSEIQPWNDSSTIHPMNTRSFTDNRVPPLIYKSGSSGEVILPESSSYTASTVDKEKLTELLQSASLRRTDKIKPLHLY